MADREPESVSTDSSAGSGGRLNEPIANAVARTRMQATDYGSSGALDETARTYGRAPR